MTQKGPMVRNGIWFPRLKALPDEGINPGPQTANVTQTYMILVTLGLYTDYYQRQ